MVLQPIAPHLSFGSALVVPADAAMELEVRTTHEARLSADGQVEIPLGDGAIVRVRRSERVAGLMRMSRRSVFYGTLMERLSERK
jgi:NAD kinase